MGSIYDSRVSLQSQTPWKTYDFLYPGGKLAKLVKIDDNSTKTIPLTDILAKLKLNDGYPVVNLIGARDTNRGKFYGGIARACFNTDAVIVDNAIGTGVEKFA
jgi:SLOG in TRPM, prokaryote